MSVSLKLIDLNIEGNGHLDVVVPFLRAHMPDVVCLQELREQDIPMLEAALEGKCFFVPREQEDGSLYGIGILSMLPSANQSIHWYGGSPEPSPVVDHSTPETAHDSQCFMLAVSDIQKGGETFHIGTTHFPVTQRGEATDFQRRDMQKLLSILETEGEFVVVGDFNAPRGGEIFSMLSARYTDNVPAEYKTSLDLILHRVARLHPADLADKMVDGIFSTPGYSVSNVSMHDGVSDHCALIATITKSA